MVNPFWLVAFLSPIASRVLIGRSYNRKSWLFAYYYGIFLFASERDVIGCVILPNKSWIWLLFFESPSQNTDGVFFTVRGSQKQDHLFAMTIGAGRFLRVCFEQIIQRDRKFRPCHLSEWSILYFTKCLLSCFIYGRSYFEILLLLASFRNLTALVCILHLCSVVKSLSFFFL